ncbi:MAG: hypothetical protein NUW37_05180 [Planctomycetes bacterium]|nr:hypothetical protein [Planctomycetota bacterium]
MGLSFSEAESRPLLLTFNVEKFDVPQDYGIAFSNDESFACAERGWCSLLSLLDEVKLRATFFVSREMAVRFPGYVECSARWGHEIAVHQPMAPASSAEFSVLDLHLELIASRCAMEQPGPGIVTECDTQRQARAVYPLASGPSFDSSSHLRSKNQIRLGGAKMLPPTISAENLARTKFVWSKLLPTSLIQTSMYGAIRRTGFIHVYFNNWEFAELPRFANPRYNAIVGRTGGIFRESMRNFFIWCRQKNLCAHQLSGTLARRS